MIKSSFWPDSTDDELPDLGPPEDAGSLVDNGETNPALEAVVQVEEAAAGQVLAVVHQHGNVLPGGGQLQDLEPNDQVVLRVDLLRTCEWK